jgi:hypothetical protein
MNIDLRFVEVGYELMMLSEYVALLETNLPTIIEAEKKRIWLDLDREDDADRSSGYHLEQRLEEGVTTRFLTAAAVTGTWAIYEATVAKMASHIQRSKEVSLRMSHLKGNFLQRARRYFDDVLKLDLHPIDTDWSRLERLGNLRNVLAHANGRLWDVPEDDRRRATSWVASTPGLTIVDEEYLIVSLAFARESLSFVDDLLRELVERVRTSF